MKYSYTVIEFDITGLSAMTSPVITGKVVDQNGNALSGVAVTTTSGLCGITDANGYYTISAPYGEYTLTFAKAGYSPEMMYSVDSISGLGVTVQTVTMNSGS